MARMGRRTTYSGYFPRLCGSTRFSGRNTIRPVLLQTIRPGSLTPSGRALARAPVGGGFPAPPFR